MVVKKMLLPSFRGYKFKWLRPDFMAALVVTAIAIPESLGYAVIVGLPVQAGLYCALLAPLVFALCTSSKRLVVGADSATAALVAAGGMAVAAAGTMAYGNAIEVLGLLTAALLAIMSFARLGFLADLISQPVLTGFISGVGVQLLLGKLPEMLGIHAKGGLLHKVDSLLAHFGSIHITTALLSLVVVSIIMLGWKLRYPGAIAALVLAALATKLLGLPTHGIEVVGSVPAGLPTFHLPVLSVKLVTTLLPIAASIAIVILAQSLAVTRSAAARHNEKVDDNRDLLSLGLANAASALTGGFAINGSPPRSSAAEMAGGRSQMVNIMMSLLIGAMLCAATGLFAFVPAASLAAVVFTIGLHLFKGKELAEILRVRRSEFAVAMVALVAVALLGVQTGVMIAVALSLIDRLRRQYHPNDEVLVHDQQFAAWAADRLTARQGLDAPSGLLVYRFDDALFFENSGYFLERVTAILQSSKNPVKLLVLDAGAMSDIDYTAAQTLKRLHKQLQAKRSELAIAHTSPHLRSLLKRYGITEVIGISNIYPTVRSAIESYIEHNVSHKDRIKALALSSSDYVVISGTALDILGIRKTKDLDLVVSEHTYASLRDKHWKEYVQDDGKRVLSRYGYKIMTQWMGYELKDLQKGARVIDGIPVMSLEKLVSCKLLMGREKDVADVELIEHFTTLAHA